MYTCVFSMALEFYVIDSLLYGGVGDQIGLLRNFESNCDWILLVCSIRSLILLYFRIESIQNIKTLKDIIKTLRQILKLKKLFD